MVKYVSTTIDAKDASVFLRDETTTWAKGTEGATSGRCPVDRDRVNGDAVQPTTREGNSRSCESVPEESKLAAEVSRRVEL